MGRGLYFNELMAKKLSLLGCVGMLIAIIVQVSVSSRSVVLPRTLLASPSPNKLCLKHDALLALPYIPACDGAAFDASTKACPDLS